MNEKKGLLIILNCFAKPSCVNVTEITFGQQTKVMRARSELELLNGHCHGGRTWKNQADFFKFGYWAPGGITVKERFRLHYTGIVIFIKTGPAFEGFRCCKMCFWNLEFLKRFSWQCPFKKESIGALPGLRGKTHVRSKLWLGLIAYSNNNRF